MMNEEDSTRQGTHSSASFRAPPDLFQRQQQMNLGVDVLETEYLASDKFVCLGCEDGVTRVLSTAKWKVQYKLHHEDKTPVMGLARSPESTGIKNAVMCVHSGGTMEYWHASSEQLLFSKKYQSSLESCEISRDGEWYVMGGENGVMLLGHLNKGDPKSLETGNIGSHANRVFCIKWDDSDPHVFYSGGWDKTVFFWDVRTKTTINKFYGYYIEGEAIDSWEGELLLGNNRDEKHLTIFDIKAGKARKPHWEIYSNLHANANVGINSCFFGETKYDVVALSSLNQARYIRQDTCVSLFSHSDHDARGFSLAKASSKNQIVASWSNGDVQVLKF